MREMEAKKRRLAKRFLRTHRKDGADWLGGALAELKGCERPGEIRAWAEQYMREALEGKQQPDGKLTHEVLDAINGILNA